MDKLVKQKTLYTRIYRFLLTGIFSAVVDYTVTMLSHYLLNLDKPMLEKTLGFIAGTTTAYLINKKWTFEAKDAKNKLIPVIILYLITWLIQIIIYKYMINWIGSDVTARTLSFVVAQGTATVINFIIQNGFIFKAKTA